jgi:sulfate/thiosulfate-binding protein
MARRRLVPALVALLAVAVVSCSNGEQHPGGAKVRLTLVAYSTPKEAYQELIRAFQRTEAGRGVTFTQSYGASGEQSRAVAAGLKADIVAFSLEPDMTRLVQEKLVAPGWTAGAARGMVTNSVAVLVVRKGNPKGIRGWDDLVRPGIDVITPNPFTSGGARWNVMAAYGAQRTAGMTHEQATGWLAAMFKQVSVQDKTARESLQTFANGKGDVLIAYENEAIIAQRKRLELDYVIPDRTILIENPIAVTASTRHPEQARAFVEFVRSAEGQRIFARNGYRPVLASALREAGFPAPRELFTIGDIGGWTDVSKRFFDPETGIMTGIERGLGVATSAG